MSSSITATWPCSAARWNLEERSLGFAADFAATLWSFRADSRAIFAAASEMIIARSRLEIT
jgi:hypothetical protein